MTQSEISEIDCWNCGEINFVIYGGEADDNVERCENCDEVIAETGIDSITIPQDKEDAKEIESRIEVEATISPETECPHPPDRVIPYSYRTSHVPPSVTVSTGFSDRETVLEKVLCLECDTVLNEQEIRE